MLRDATSPTRASTWPGLWHRKCTRLTMMLSITDTIDRLCMLIGTVTAVLLDGIVFSRSSTRDIMWSHHVPTKTTFRRMLPRKRDLSSVIIASDRRDIEKAHSNRKNIQTPRSSGAHQQVHQKLEGASTFSSRPRSSPNVNSAWKNS